MAKKRKKSALLSIPNVSKSVQPLTSNEMQYLNNLSALDANQLMSAVQQMRSPMGNTPFANLANNQNIPSAPIQQQAQMLPSNINMSPQSNPIPGQPIVSQGVQPLTPNEIQYLNNLADLGPSQVIDAIQQMRAPQQNANNTIQTPNANVANTITPIQQQNPIATQPMVSQNVQPLTSAERQYLNNLSGASPAAVTNAISQMRATPQMQQISSALPQQNNISAQNALAPIQQNVNPIGINPGNDNFNNLSTTLPTGLNLLQQQQRQPQNVQQQGGFWNRVKNFFGKARDVVVGQPESLLHFTNYTPFQQHALNQSALSGLQSLQNPYGGFDPIAQRATSLFHQNTVPLLAERFTSLGNNAMSSPAFTSQLGQAGSGLSEALAALQSQYGLQNRQQGLRELALGTTPQYQAIRAGGGGGLLGGFMQGGGLEALAKIAPLFLM